MGRITFQEADPLKGREREGGKAMKGEILFLLVAK